MKYATIHVSRNGEILGQWPSYAIRPMFLAGELLPSDMVWAEGLNGWHRLVPEAPVKHEDFPYMGDETPCYFIRNGQLFGPRHPDEIDALVQSGFLSEEDWISCYGAERWHQVRELLEEETSSGTTEAEHGPDWMKLGVGLLGSILLGIPMTDD